MTGFDAVRLQVEAKDGHLKVHLRIEKERWAWISFLEYQQRAETYHVAVERQHCSARRVEG